VTRSVAFIAHGYLNPFFCNFSPSASLCFLRYDKRAMICVWNVDNSTAYNYVLMTFGIFVPAAAISILYWLLYK